MLQQRLRAALTRLCGISDSFGAAVNIHLREDAFHMRLGSALQFDCKIPRCQHVTEANPTEKLGTDPIRNHIDHFRSILRRIDVDAERPFAKWRIDHLHDGVRDGGYVRIGWYN